MRGLACDTAGKRFDQRFPSSWLWSAWILVDTNVVYALTDVSDDEHQRCLRWFDALPATETLLLLPTVLAEVCYLVNDRLGPAAEASVLSDVGVGSGYPYQLAELISNDVRRMGELVQRHADRRLGGTDASIIAVAERRGITTIAAMNRRDFDNVRPNHAAAFTIVPE